MPELGKNFEIFLDHPQRPGGEAVPASAFAHLLQDHESLRLVVLNACQGAARSATAALAGVSSPLLRHGVPAVVAMQSSIPNGWTLRFATELYGELAAGRWAGQVEGAVARSRGALLQERPYGPDFANPVLYLRAPDGCLWQPAEADAAEHFGSAATVSGGDRQLPGTAERKEAAAPPRLGGTNAPPAPPLFLGRAADLARLKERLGIGGGPAAPVQVLTAVRG